GVQTCALPIFDGDPWLRKRDAETAVEAFACEREVSKAEMNPSADRDADPRHTHSSIWREKSVVTRTRREPPARRSRLRFRTEVRKETGRLRAPRGGSSVRPESPLNPCVRSPAKRRVVRR